MALLPIKIPPGFYRNATQYQAKGRWFNGNLVRFSEGRLRPIGGWQRLSPTQMLKKGLINKVTILDGGTGYTAGTLTASGGGGSSFAASFTVDGSGTINAVTITNRGSGYTSDPTIVINNAGNSNAILKIYAFTGQDPVRGMHSWRLSSGARYLAIGTVQSLRIWDGSQSAGVNSPIYDITPASSAVPSGNIPFNLQEDFLISGLGYGSLGYSDDVYGTPRFPAADPNIIDENAFRDNYASVISIDNFGDDALFCHSGEGTIWHWASAGASFNNGTQTATAPTRVTNAPTSCVSVLVTPERHILALGAGGSQRTIQWASAQSLTDWSPTVTNTAGSIEVQAKGRIIGGFKTRYGVLIFFTDSVWKTNYLGPPYIYSVERLTEGGGCLGMKSVTGSADFTAWMSRGRFWSYTGGYVTELACDVADYVFSDLNTDVSGLIAGFHNAEFGEVSWSYPREGDDYNTRYVTYSYREKHWVTGELERSQWESSDSLGYPVGAGVDGFLYRHEMDPDTQSTPILREANVVAPTDVAALSTVTSRVIAKGVSISQHPNVATENHMCFAETGAIELSQNAGDKYISVSQIITDTDAGAQNGLRLKVTVANTPDDTNPVVKGPYPLEGDGYTDTRFSGRQVLLRVESPYDQEWRVGEFRMDSRASGSR